MMKEVPAEEQAKALAEAQAQLQLHADMLSIAMLRFEARYLKKYLPESKTITVAAPGVLVQFNYTPTRPEQLLTK